jgi:hypothetical protein
MIASTDCQPVKCERYPELRVASTICGDLFVVKGAEATASASPAFPKEMAEID